MVTPRNFLFRIQHHEDTDQKIDFIPDLTSGLEAHYTPNTLSTGHRPCQSLAIFNLYDVDYIYVSSPSHIGWYLTRRINAIPVPIDRGNPLQFLWCTTRITSSNLFQIQYQDWYCIATDQAYVIAAIPRNFILAIGRDNPSKILIVLY